MLWSANSGHNLCTRPKCPEHIRRSDASGDCDDMAALYVSIYHATAGNINLIGVNANASDPYTGACMAATLYGCGFGHVSVGTFWTSGANFQGTIDGGVLTVTEVQSGALAVNQAISGASVANNVYISSLGSGVGGLGTYFLSGASDITVSSAQAMSSSPGLTANWPSSSSDGTDLTGCAPPLASGKSYVNWYTKAIAKGHPGILAGYTSWNTGSVGLTNPLVPGWQNLLDCCLSAPDNSITIVSIGLQSCLAGALSYPGNYRNSGMNGEQIIAAKVTAIYVLPGGNVGELNLPRQPKIFYQRMRIVWVITMVCTRIFSQLRFTMSS